MSKKFNWKNIGLFLLIAPAIPLIVGFLPLLAYVVLKYVFNYVIPIVEIILWLSLLVYVLGGLAAYYRGDFHKNGIKHD